MLNREELDIIEGCRRGSRVAQEALYKRFSRKMYGICLTYAKDEEAARDILQEGFIKVFDNISGLMPDSTLEAWVRRIMVNTAIDYFRKSIKTIWKKTSLDNSILPADDDVLSRINEKQLLEIIKSLPSGYKVVFNLYVIEGFNHREIGEMLGISEGTSKSQFFYAKKMLKERITELYGQEVYKGETHLIRVHG